MTTTVRSHTVHRILRLHAQADRQALREVRATARAERLGRRLYALRMEAWALEERLDDSSAPSSRGPARVRCRRAPRLPPPGWGNPRARPRAAR